MRKLVFLSSNSESSATELLGDIEEIFILYYMDSDVMIRFQTLTTHRCATRRGRVKYMFWNAISDCCVLNEE